ncbi:MAG: PEP-CTERM sorting domain-containing protein [Verrucomicrobiales bacterium]|nr:PEP-CTERM sorting domain-containing protein [Verrucomicrobiota bacterium JB025]
MKQTTYTLTAIAALASTAAGGIYSSYSDDPGNAHDAPVSKTDSSIMMWASTVIDYAPTANVSASYTNPETGYGCLGDLTTAEISSGAAPGSITVGFDAAITNGTGADFAVFENGFTFGSGLFMELAYVEVSSNGTDFVRFDSISTNTVPVAGSGGFSSWDTTNVYNLAGKHASGWGTPFDLDELTGNSLVTAGLVYLDHIQYIRLVDIPGSGDYTDSLGNPIYDAYYTTGSGGYDFRLSEGVAMLNGVPEPTALTLLALGGLLVCGKRTR